MPAPDLRQNEPETEYNSARANDAADAAGILKPAMPCRNLTEANGNPETAAKMILRNFL